MGIIDQKIFPYSPTVKGKIAGWIFLDNSSYDEYSERSKEFWGHHVMIVLGCLGGGKGRTVLPFSHVWEAEPERWKGFRRCHLGPASEKNDENGNLMSCEMRSFKRNYLMRLPNYYLAFYLSNLKAL